VACVAAVKAAVYFTLRPFTFSFGNSA